MAAILTENFNSYTDWDIVWQGSWISQQFSTNYDIQWSVVQEWAKALALIAWSHGWSPIIYKTWTAVADWTQAFYVRKTVTNEEFLVLLEQHSTLTWAIVKFSTGWQIQYFNGSTYVDIQSYSADTWYLIEVEWRTSDNTARYRIDGWSWTSFVAVNWTFTSIDSIRLIWQATTSWTAYVDNFYDPSVTTNSNFLAFF